MKMVCQPRTKNQRRNQVQMKLDVSSLAHTKWECKYHIVFAPKYRRQIIYGKIKQDIGQMIRKLCQYKGIEIHEAEACKDHIHIFVSLLSASGTRPYPRGLENRRRVGACLRLHCVKNAAGSPNRETTCRVCRSAARKRERGNRVLSLAAGASDCQDPAICHNDRWQNRYDLRLAAVRSGLGPAFCRGSAMVDPADAARLRGWTNGTAMHVPPGRAGKVVVSFLLSAAGGLLQRGFA